MKKHIINLTFSTFEEAQKWEDEHIVNRMYEGGVVLMVSHTDNGQGITVDFILTV